MINFFLSFSLIFSLVALYYMNRISQVKYAAPIAIQTKQTPKKKK